MAYNQKQFGGFLSKLSKFKKPSRRRMSTKKAVESVKTIKNAINNSPSIGKYR